ncbi:uncharacterized protein LOC119167967 isoform X2 [Rhipicephalus microplus]|uniref:uncharacterized protein LOC119167967 isoform X2 n=1 Tax=Rhipicephalus microplus TaxID=6941 RepID=UPI003F6BB916
MAENIAFSCVFVFLGVASSNGVIEKGAVPFLTQDIRKFVHTEEPIWTWTTTNIENVLCKVDEMKSYTQGSIFFSTKYYAYKILKPILKNYEGIFSTEQPNVMRLRKSGFKSAVFVGKEILIYWRKKFRCAVIKVAPSLRGHQPYYELRVWNSTASVGPHEKCTRRFQKLGKKGRVIYHSKCQDILKV